MILNGVRNVKDMPKNKDKRKLIEELEELKHTGRLYHCQGYYNSAIDDAIRVVKENAKK